MEYINDKKQAIPIIQDVPKELLNIHIVSQAKQKSLGDAQALKKARTPPICAKPKSNIFGFRSG